MKKYRIALDVDGILADFYKGICEYNNMPLRTLDKWGIPWVEDVFHEITDDHNFWSSLEMISKPSDIVFDFDIYLTSLPPQMKENRTNWLRRLGYPYKPVVVANDKFDYAVKNNINVMIDDKKETIDKFNNNGLIGIKYLPYYMKYEETKYNITNLKQVPSILLNL